MFGNDRKEAEENVRRLEALIADLQEIPTSRPAKPDDVLRLLETAMAKSRGCNSWLANAERLAWRISAPLWDFRLRRQIRLVHEFANATSWGSSGTTDAVRHLDDMVFARTYGRIVAAPIKWVLRDLASKGEFATHELRNLIINRCLRVDQDGRVFVPTERWLFWLGILQFAFATLVLVPYMLLVLLVNADFGQKILGLTVFAAPYWMACWTFRRYFISPYRLIPRAQKQIPKLQIVGE